jgi:hypothetical protein
MHDKASHFVTCLLITFLVGLFLGVWWGIGASVAAGTVAGLFVLLGVKHIAGV